MTLLLLYHIIKYHIKEHNFLMHSSPIFSRTKRNPENITLYLIKLNVRLSLDKNNIYCIIKIVFVPHKRSAKVIVEKCLEIIYFNVIEIK